MHCAHCSVLTSFPATATTEAPPTQRGHCQKPCTMHYAAGEARRYRERSVGAPAVVLLPCIGRSRLSLVCAKSRDLGDLKLTCYSSSRAVASTQLLASTRLQKGVELFSATRVVEYSVNSISGVKCRRSNRDITMYMLK